jgi:hypothetical protein
MQLEVGGDTSGLQAGFRQLRWISADPLHPFVDRNSTYIRDHPQILSRNSTRDRSAANAPSFFVGENNHL